MGSPSQRITQRLAVLGDLVPAVVKAVAIKIPGGGLGHIAFAVSRIGGKIGPLQGWVPELLRKGPLGGGLMEGIGEGGGSLGFQGLQVVIGGHFGSDRGAGVFKQGELCYLPGGLVQDFQGLDGGRPRFLYRFGQGFLDHGGGGVSLDQEAVPQDQGGRNRRRAFGIRDRGWGGIGLEDGDWEGGEVQEGLTGIEKNSCGDGSHRDSSKGEKRKIAFHGIHHLSNN